MKITLIGRPIAKKNSRRIFQGRGRGIVSIPSHAYVNWEIVAMSQIRAYSMQRFTGYVSIDYTFRFKGDMSVDVDNAMAGINDILEKTGVVRNDKLIVCGTFSLTWGHPEWETDLVIIDFVGDVGRKHGMV